MRANNFVKHSSQQIIEQRIELSTQMRWKSECWRHFMQSIWTILSNFPFSGMEISTKSKLSCALFSGYAMSILIIKSMQIEQIK
jgi:hypothetical protein